jgi:mxaJ protein
MSSGFSATCLAAALSVAATSAADDRNTVTMLSVRRTDAPPSAERSDVLRVCADPNNLPFSNVREEGFENAIARLAAEALRRRLEYYWLPQRRGFVRNSLKAGVCDVVIGVPSASDMTRTTRAYYRSSYVFVTRKDGRLVSSLDDRALRGQRVGVQVIGDDYQNSPAAQALANRGLVANVHGFPVYGDYRSAVPLESIVDAVVDRSIDVAVVWGPVAGYLASRTDAPLTLTPVTPQIDLPYLPFVFDISMGVRRTDPELGDALDAFLASHRAAIADVLARFHVPTLVREEEAR